MPTLVALGVVYARANRIGKAIDVLRRANQAEPTNPVVHQNLGGCLLKNGDLVEAVAHLRQALALDPSNLQAKLGLGQALESHGDFADADLLYQDILATGSGGSLIELAKEGRTRISHANLRRVSGERPDVVMYCLGALERFAEMTDEQIRNLGQEIAILGMKGLDINDPAKKYQLKNLPGEFSGLHLVSLMYAAYQQIAPGTDVGIDLSREYEAATRLFQERNDG